MKFYPQNEILVQAFVHSTINIAMYMLYVLQIALCYITLHYTVIYWGFALLFAAFHWISLHCTYLHWWTGRLTSPQADLPVKHEGKEVRMGIGEFRRVEIGERGVRKVRKVGRGVKSWVNQGVKSWVNHILTTSLKILVFPFFLSIFSYWILCITVCRITTNILCHHANTCGH